MRVFWIWIVIAASGAAGLTDEEYYQLPKLFDLDDYEECLVEPDGAFCLGSFHLAERSNTQLMRLINDYTADRYHFNRTRIHRGVCVSTSCTHIQQGSLPDRFEACVDNVTRSNYGLEARLLHLDYCQVKDAPDPIDGVDLGFAVLVLAILAGNVLGTAYDLLRNQDDKPNRYLISWSLRANWDRLTATHQNGDPRLNALKPVHGMKAITLIFVMLAHSIIVYHMSYLYNPQFLETASRHPLSTILHNGSVIVQTFIMLSSFLLAFNLLLFADNDPNKGLSLLLFPKVILQRYVRITPVHLFVVGLTATWWRLASSGPLWNLMETESAICRSKWWMQALYVHNFIQPDKKCLWQTWFLAVDMQLYIVAAILTLILGRRPRRAPLFLFPLLLISIAANYFVAYNWNLKSIMYLTYPEYMRNQYFNEESFKWLYAAPWGSLPSSLLGLMVAFWYYDLQKEGVNLKEKMWCRVAIRLAVPGILIAIFSGYLIRNATSREVLSLYSALDRPLFTVVIIAAMIGFFFKIDEAVWKLMSWQGWAVLSRMSLSVLMVHWLYNVTQVAIRTNLARASIYEIGGHWFVTLFMTYVSALPLHLLVEQPLQRFLQALV